MYKEMHLDFETRSAADLKECGTFVYFEHASTDVLCACYSFDEEEEIHVWQRGDEVPQNVIDFVQGEGVIVAWNAAFERTAWFGIMVKKHDWPTIAFNRFRCAMVQSLAMNLPRALDNAAQVLGCAQKKDKAGKTLMMKMCKPRKNKLDETGVNWRESEDEIYRLTEYCKQDVRTECAISAKLLKLRPQEERLYQLDAVINARGVYIDIDFCLAAAEVITEAKEGANEKLRLLTNHAVLTCDSSVSMVKHLSAYDKSITSVAKAECDALLAAEGTHPHVKEVLTLRELGSKNSVGKIDAFLNRCTADGRVKGSLQFYGASATGRWAARGVQLQNLPRPTLIGSKELEPAPLEHQIEVAMDTVKLRNTAFIEMCYGSPLALISDCIRSVIKAPKGHDLMAADFSNIEGRVVAWLAGQHDKIEAFASFDRGEGADLYLIAAAGIYGVPISEAKPYRQIGKVAELSLGYQGGAVAFEKMSKDYGVRIAEMYDNISEMAAGHISSKASDNWESFGPKSGMSKKAFLAAEMIKLAWREKNHAIAAYWTEVENAAIEAMTTANTPVKVRNIAFIKRGNYLFCRLPSGRLLTYPFPKLRESTTPWGAVRNTIVYKTTDQSNFVWGEKAFYGGLGVENITQAVARDIMAEAMVRVEEAGYTTILTVHDEIVNESPIDFGSLDEYIAIMTKRPEWALDLPITAGGWRGIRYRKS